VNDKICLKLAFSVSITWFSLLFLKPPLAKEDQLHIQEVIDEIEEVNSIKKLLNSPDNCSDFCNRTLTLRVEDDYSEEELQGLSFGFTLTAVSTQKVFINAFFTPERKLVKTIDGTTSHSLNQEPTEQNIIWGQNFLGKAPLIKIVSDSPANGIFGLGYRKAGGQYGYVKFKIKKQGSCHMFFKWNSSTNSGDRYTTRISTIRASTIGDSSAVYTFPVFTSFILE
jgi:hypothetical protein